LPRHLRVLRRLTWTEADPFGQFDKLRHAYDIAYWSETHFNNRGLFSDYYLTNRLRPADGSAPEFPEWSEDPRSQLQFRIMARPQSRSVAGQRLTRGPWPRGQTPRMLLKPVLTHALLLGSSTCAVYLP
jgi:hypothetical protein